MQSWINQLRWQRLKPMEKLARMLLDHLEGILNYKSFKHILETLMRDTSVPSDELQLSLET